MKNITKALIVAICGLGVVRGGLDESWDTSSEASSSSNNTSGSNIPLISRLMDLSELNCSQSRFHSIPSSTSNSNFETQEDSDSDREDNEISIFERLHNFRNNTMSALTTAGETIGSFFKASYTRANRFTAISNCITDDLDFQNLLTICKSCLTNQIDDNQAFLSLLNPSVSKDLRFISEYCKKHQDQKYEDMIDQYLDGQRIVVNTREELINIQQGTFKAVLCIEADINSNIDDDQTVIDDNQTVIKTEYTDDIANLSSLTNVVMNQALHVISKEPSNDDKFQPLPANASYASTTTEANYFLQSFTTPNSKAASTVPETPDDHERMSTRTLSPSTSSNDLSTGIIQEFFGDRRIYPQWSPNLNPGDLYKWDDGSIWEIGQDNLGRQLSLEPQPSMPFEQVLVAVPVEVLKANRMARAIQLSSIMPGLQLSDE